MQPAISTGTVLQSRYRVLSILGQGGFGRTYLAEDQGRFNELCAIKELIPPQDSSYGLEKSKELFQREAQTLYKIQHPQIPQFRATFEQEQRFFIVQDYVAGKTYRTLLDERKQQGFVFSEAEVLQLVKQVLPVLSYLHGQGIIHRDIAPDNIIYRDRDRLPVLIDFGVVKELATRIQATETVRQQTTVGKLGYAPTEQMQTGRAYPNSDLYALAVTAIVLLTGREPQELFDENTLTWRWNRFVTLSPTFADVLNRMLSQRVNDRYQSASEALQALSQPATMAPIPAAQPPINAPSPPTSLSQVETVAIGHRSANSSLEPTAFQNRAEPTIPSRSSIFDDPLAVLAIGAGLVLLTGLGAWTITRTLLNSSQPAPSPTPTETIASPTPSVTPTTRPSSPSPTPSAEPVTYSQQLDLSSGTATRNATLRSNETLNFIVPAQQGQRLSTNLSSEGVLLSVLAPNRDPVDNNANRVSNWSGELPFTGNYTIQLRTVKGIPKSDFKLNVSLQTPSPSPSPSPTESPLPSPSINVTPIVFAPGETGTVLRGTASPQITQRFTLNAKRNQLVNLQISGATFTVRYPNGNPVEDATNLSNWRAQLPRSGVYQIDVTADRSTNFTLNVDVRF